ncbi:MAG: leucine-rich repeat domain-containing protein [Clostridia bacterium]|nr:leucine-rich repeat domain-containing protein [Clostridia bacterium]
MKTLMKKLVVFALCVIIAALSMGFCACKNGETESSAVGIKNVFIDGDGCLMVVLTDGRTINAGDLSRLGISEQGDEQGLAFYKMDDGNYAVGVGTAALLSEIVIPAVYKGKSVKTVISRGFADCRSVKITIPDSVSFIADNAFAGCASLTEINIPDGTTVGIGAFENCRALKTITWPSDMEDIPFRAFAGCWQLREVEISDKVKRIASDAFGDCPNFAYSEYGNGLYFGNEKNPYRFFMKPKNLNDNACVLHPDTEIINDGAFKNSLVVSLNIPESVKIISELSLFENCFNFASFTVDENNGFFSAQDGILYDKEKTELLCVPQKISGAIAFPSTLKNVRSFAFRDCSELTEVVLSDGVKLEQGVFEGCTKLSHVVLPEDLTFIPSYLFQKCASLKDLVIPDSVKNIDNFAFFDSGLTEITIPAGVSKIGDCAFMGCSDLENIYFENAIGWKAGDREIAASDLENGETAAYCLTSQYCRYTWTRGD